MSVLKLDTDTGWVQIPPSGPVPDEPRFTVRTAAGWYYHVPPDRPGAKPLKLATDAGWITACHLGDAAHATYVGMTAYQQQWHAIPPDPLTLDVAATNVYTDPSDPFAYVADARSHSFPVDSGSGVVLHQVERFAMISLTTDNPAGSSVRFECLQLDDIAVTAPDQITDRGYLHLYRLPYPDPITVGPVPPITAGSLVYTFTYGQASPGHGFFGDTYVWDASSPDPPPKGISTSGWMLYARATTLGGFPADGEDRQAGGLVQVRIGVAF